ncbi:hypothetical protein EGW08_016369, partial [Elysia chlorotica]
MLFGGPNKESAPSSGTASPASVPPGVQHKMKTLAELEADLHQSSPHKPASPASTTGPATTQEGGSGDMTAFNKLLFMMNAGPEANQNNTSSEAQNSRPGFPMIPSYSQFSKAVLRNKEEQKLLQQTAQHQLMAGLVPSVSQHQPHLGQPPAPGQAISAAALQQMQLQQAGLAHRTAGKMPFSLTPQAMSTPHSSAVTNQARPHSSSSVGPILSLIQQNPSIVMKPASPGMSAPQQQSQTGMPKTARVASPM